MRADSYLAGLIDLARAWNPADHPRGPDGRFIKGFGVGAFFAAVTKAATPRPDLTPEDAAKIERARIRRWLAENPVNSKSIVDTWEQATPGEKAAGLSWYPNAHKIAKAMAEEHDVPLRTAAGLIAAYSPQTPWGQNLIAANEVLRHVEPVGGKGAHFNVSLDVVNEPGVEKRLGFMASNVNRKRAAALLAREEFHGVFAGKPNKSGDLPPKALKIRAFGELIANGGTSDDVVIDRHAAGVARGVRLTKDDYNVDGPSSSGKKYEVYAEAYKAASQEISEKLGRKVTPSQVQAVTWLTRQRLNNSVRARKSLGERDDRESLNYFAQLNPDIAEILGGGMVGYVQLANHLGLIDDIDLARFNPADHPRGPDGRFIDKGAIARALFRRFGADAGPRREPPEKGIVPQWAREEFYRDEDTIPNLPEGWSQTDPFTAWWPATVMSKPSAAQDALLEAVRRKRLGKRTQVFKGPRGDVVTIETPAARSDGYSPEQIRNLVTLVDTAVQATDRPGTKIGEKPVHFLVPEEWDAGENIFAYVLLGDTDNVAVGPHLVKTDPRSTVAVDDRFALPFYESAERAQAHLIAHELGHLNHNRSKDLDAPDGPTTMMPVAPYEDEIFWQETTRSAQGVFSSLPERPGRRPINRRGSGSTAGQPQPPRPLSEYAEEGGPFEAYAEAFAAHALAPGEIPAATKYAERYGWEKPDAEGT